MRIVCVSVEEFRRFAKRAVVRLDGRLIAILGPNEAGKTSLLEAIASLNDDAPLAPRDSTRDISTAEPTITATFELEAKDHEAIQQIPGAADIRTCIVTKSADGHRSAQVEPRPPHNFLPRGAAKESSNQMMENAVLDLASRNGAMHFAWHLLEDLCEWLDSDEEPLPPEFLRVVDAVLQALTQASGADQTSNGDAEEVDAFVAQLEALRSHESRPPGVQSEQLLLERIPHFLQFADADRNLRPSYVISEHAEDPAPALKNLASLADLDLEVLSGHLEAGRGPQVVRACEVASERLAGFFADSWVREDVTPTLHVDGDELIVYARAAGGEALSEFHEKSDGFRWFVALVAFVSGQPAHASLPVLLIDEAETHLSYDAQANLTRTLAEQTVAQLVLYTTHSAGCLPPDLGTGLRVVVPDNTCERSEVRNGFWDNAPGYTPLMLAMGASALAFTPARRVILAEGPSDCILLPTLLREARGLDVLSFQIAPGLSTVSRSAMSDVLSMAGQVAYLVDGDEGGNKRRKFLLSIGFPEARILSYKDVGRLSITLEDLVRPSTFVIAAQLEVERWQKSSLDLSDAEMPSELRMIWLDRVCKAQGLQPIAKTTLAQRIVDMRDGYSLVDPKRKALLCRVWERLEQILNGREDDERESSRR